MEEDEYVSVAFVKLVTVNVTLVVLTLRPVLETEHKPLVLVVQVIVPVAPLVHFPVTVTFGTKPSFALCTVMVTFAFHLEPERVAERSRSPTCMVGDDVAVKVAVGSGVEVNVAVGSGVDVNVAVGRGVDVKVGKGVAVLAGPGVGVG